MALHFGSGPAHLLQQFLLFSALALTSVDEAVPKLEWLATATDSVTTQSSELPTPPRLLANKCARSLRDVPNVRVEDKQREHGRQLAFASAAFFARDIRTSDFRRGKCKRAFCTNDPGGFAGN